MNTVGISKRRLSPAQITEICERYKSRESAPKLAEEFGVSSQTIYEWLERNGVQRCSSTTQRRLNAEQEEALIACYSAGESSRALAAEFGVSQRSVFRVLHHYGVPTRSRAEANRKYACDGTFFRTINTEEKAYWLGFLAADGYVDTKHATLVVALARRDREHLRRLLRSLKSTHPVKDYEYEHAISIVSIRLPELAQGLVENGVIPRKTFTLDWPGFLSRDLLRHYLRGYSDGDGCFNTGLSSYVRKGDGGRASKTRWVVVGNETFLLAAQNFVAQQTGVQRLPLRPAHDCKPGIAEMSYGGSKQVARLAHMLYDDATVYLPRKREKIAQLID